MTKKITKPTKTWTVKNKPSRKSKPKNFVGLDLEQLQDKPCVGLMLRLMAIQNDIEMIPYLTRLIENDLKDKPEQKRFYDAMKWYLLRSRQSIGAEGVMQTMHQIKKKERPRNSPYKPIWDLIKKKPKIEEHFREIEKYLPGEENVYPPGKYYVELEKSYQVRNRTYHYEHANELIGEDLKSYVALLKEHGTTQWAG
jgi:hypothetical protein